MRGEGMLEAIHDGNELLDDAGGGALTGLAIVFFGALAEIGKVRLVTDQGLTHVFQFGGEFLASASSRAVSSAAFFSSPLSWGGTLISNSRVLHECFLNSSSVLLFNLT